MKLKSALFVGCALLLLGRVPAASGFEPSEVLDLWPGKAPGEKGDIGEERDTTKPTDGKVDGKPVIRMGNVSKPALAIYRPAPEKDTGAAVLVCPGGGYHILAMDLEGTEICEWLNSIGVTLAVNGMPSGNACPLLMNARWPDFLNRETSNST